MGAGQIGRNVDRKYSNYPGYDVGMGITRFQDFLFSINDRPERQLTDEELSAEMHEEHPLGRRISADYRERVSVRTVRRRYNSGTQNHGPASTQSWPYWLENGKRVRHAYPAPYVT
jgi:hypothetical protein